MKRKFTSTEKGALWGTAFGTSVGAATGNPFAIMGGMWFGGAAGAKLGSMWKRRR